MLSSIASPCIYALRIQHAAFIWLLLCLRMLLAQMIMKEIRIAPCSTNRQRNKYQDKLMRNLTVYRLPKISLHSPSSKRRVAKRNQKVSRFGDMTSQIPLPTRRRSSSRVPVRSASTCWTGGSSKSSRRSTRCGVEVAKSGCATILPAESCGAVKQIDVDF